MYHLPKVFKKWQETNNQYVYSHMITAKIEYTCPEKELDAGCVSALLYWM